MSIITKLIHMSCVIVRYLAIILKRATSLRNQIVQGNYVWNFLNLVLDILLWSRVWIHLICDSQINWARFILLYTILFVFSIWLKSMIIFFLLLLSIYNVLQQRITRWKRFMNLWRQVFRTSFHHPVSRSIRSKHAISWLRYWD